MIALTYSFLDTMAAIVGPGGSFNLGSGSGAAEEGISVVQAEDFDRMLIGADSTPMHSLIANKSGTVTVRLLKTSPTNALLSAMAALQRASAANHGQNQLTITNSVTGDIINCQSVAFARIPDLNYGAQAGINEWKFNVGIMDVALGAGVQQ